MWRLARQRAFWMGILVGIALGLFVGWVVWPVSYTDAYPSELRKKDKLEYLLLVARDYKQTGNRRPLVRRLQTFDRTELVPLLQDALQTYENSDDKAALRQLLETVQENIPTTAQEEQTQEASAQPSPRNGGFSLSRVASIFFILLGGIILLYVFLRIAALLRKKLPQPRMSAPREEDWEPGEVEVVDVLEEMEEKDEEPQEPVSTAESLLPPSLEREEVEAATKPTPPPEPPAAPSLRLVEVLSPVFLLQEVGEEGYDESFSIEENGERLGECGVGEIESLPGKDGQPIVMEVWLLDKADAKTHQAYILSPWAYKQPDIRQKYEDQGIVFMAQHGNTVRLNARSLYLEGEIKDVAFTQAGEGNQVFSKLAMEMKVYRRIGARA